MPTLKTESTYPYAHFLPTFDRTLRLPPLTPFDHVDPGRRALDHPDPRSFLQNASVVQLTPSFGTEVRGINLAELDNNGRDQLALEVQKRYPIFQSPFNHSIPGRTPRIGCFQRSTGFHQQRP